MKRIWRAALALAVVAVIAAACGEDDGGDGAADTPQEGVVRVRLYEWGIEAEPASVPAGEVTFEVLNDGGEPHELVIARTDLAPDALPTAEDGSVDEAGPDLELIDEIEEFEAGTEESLTVQLDPGSYVLFCNLVDEAGEHGEEEAHSHYREGMHTALTVD